MKVLKFIPLIVFIFLFQSCSLFPGDKGNPCAPPALPTKHYLSEFDKSKVPYTCKDTLTYFSDKGDTVVFVGNGKDTSWYCKSTVMDPDCLPQRDCYEVYGAKYIAIKGEGNFEFRQGKKMVIQYINTPTTDYPDMIEIYINLIHFTIFSPIIGDKRNPRFIGTITLNGYNFENASSINSDNIENLSGKGYYNSTHGLFYFEDKNNNTSWTLIP